MATAAVDMELEQRIAAATEAETVRGFIFRQAYATVRTVAGDAAAASCLLSIQRTRWVDFLSYPVTDCLRFMCASVEKLEPKLGSRKAAFFKLGYDAAHEFLTSPLGKVASTLAASDPRRLLGILPTAFRMTVSYGERSVTWTGPTSARIAFRHDFFNGPFQEGVLTSALTLVGAKDVDVHGTALGLLDMDYEARWS